jgi:hypothetical protein
VKARRNQSINQQAREERKGRRGRGEREEGEAVVWMSI